MKQLVRLLGIGCLLACGVYGQRMGSGGVRGGFLGRGFGFGHGFRGGFGAGIGFRGGSYRPFYGPRFFGGFYAPLFAGGYYGYPGYDSYYDAYPPYPPPPPPPPNVTLVYPPPPQYAVPEPQAPAPEAESRSPEQPGRSVYFQIAARDGSVYAALAYWVEGSTLHFMDFDGRHRQMPLSQVDRKRSEDLNDARNVEFRLPPG